MENGIEFLLQRQPTPRERKIELLLKRFIIYKVNSFVAAKISHFYAKH